MGESATAVDVAQSTEKTARFGFGRTGWLFMLAYSAFVVIDSVLNRSGADIVIYSAALIIGGYLWFLFLKGVLKALKII